MIERIEVQPGLTLDDYATYAHLSGAVHDLRTEAAMLAPHLAGRTVWMVSSTPRGGGVAEMLPTMVALFRELSVATEWAVIHPDEDAFFPLTKKLHNLIHGAGEPTITAEERALYDRVSERLAAAMRRFVKDDDILVVHDPQPAGMGALLEHRLASLVTVWRCHIGLDESTPQTRLAWDMLEPYLTTYDHAVFSVAEYIPPYLTGRSTVIEPSIDPLSAKNRPLSPHQITGILCNGGLMQQTHPLVSPDFLRRAERLRPDGTYSLACEDDIGLLFRPIVTQISRWDRLKGWGPLLEAFVELKKRRHTLTDLSERDRRRLELVRLVMAGPEPALIQDDPEAVEVLAELERAYCALDPELQRDIALIQLPMTSAHDNALMVNALQKCSTVVVQNSLREGFGLTVTEAMWKRAAVLVSGARGLRAQVRDELDGRIHPHPEDPKALARLMIEMLNDPRCRDLWSRSGQRRVHDEFLVFSQLRKWLRLLAQAREGTIAAKS